MYMQCVVCFDDVTSAIVCANQHPVCDECCASLVTSAAERIASNNDLEHDAAHADQGTAVELSGRLLCPCSKASAGGCDSRPYADSQLAQHISESAFETYVQARTLLPIAQKARAAFEEAQSTLRDELGELKQAKAQQSQTSRKLLAKQLQQQMPDARQCLQCGFGPVDHMKCEDLAAHHGQDMGNGIRIDNSCKRCGWFSADHADWPRWDGMLHGDLQPSAAEGEALMAQHLEAAEVAATKAEAALAAKMAEQAEAAEHVEALRKAGEADQKEAIRQRKLVEQWKLEHSRASDELADMKAKEKRRLHEQRVAAVARMAEMKGYSTLDTGARPLVEGGRAVAMMTSAQNGAPLHEGPVCAGSRRGAPSKVGGPNNNNNNNNNNNGSCGPRQQLLHNQRPASARPRSSSAQTPPPTPRNPPPQEGEAKLSDVLRAAEPAAELKGRGTTPRGSHRGCSPMVWAKKEPKLSEYLRAAEGGQRSRPCSANSVICHQPSFRTPALPSRSNMFSRPPSAGFTKPHSQPLALVGPMKALQPLPPIGFAPSA